MKRMHLIAVAVAGALAAGSALAQGQDRQKAAAGAESASGAPVIVLVPVQVASRDTFSNGCWARLYDGGDYQGNQLSLVGPVDMPNMRTAFGTDWSGEFDSIEVGPKATLTVYDNENYGEKAATFKPGQRVPDLSDKLGFFQDISSVKIACAGGGTAQGAQNGNASSGASAGGDRFERLDTDNSGTLSRSEYQKMK